MHLWTRRCLLAAPLALAASPAIAQAPPARILFVGNSQTYINNVPGLVQACFTGAGLACDVGMVARANYGLQDHWTERPREARREIGRGGWTHVVLQQGPSARADSRANLREYVGRFAPLVSEAGARLALYSVWPTRDRAQDFARARESYALAAEDVGAALCPAGEAWRIALSAEPSPDLYAPDGLHATGFGSYLAALVIFSVISGRGPIGSPNVLTFADGTRARVPDELAATLQNAAAQALT